MAEQHAAPRVKLRQCLAGQAQRQQLPEGAVVQALHLLQVAKEFSRAGRFSRRL